MDRLLRADGLIHCAGNGRIGEKVTITDRLGHPGKILVDHAPGTQIHVPDLGIAHLAIRQADIHTRAGDQRMRCITPQFIPEGGVGCHDGIGVGRLAVAETVKNHQNQGLGGCTHGSGTRLCIDWTGLTVYLSGSALSCRAVYLPDTTDQSGPMRRRMAVLCRATGVYTERLLPAPENSACSLFNS